MSQLPLFQALSGTVTVSELTRYLRDLLESDDLLQNVWVQGEISNLSRPSSGHIYFSLKDAGASLRCVMWRPNVSRLDFSPEVGMEVEVHGHISVYEVSGQYQLYAQAIQPLGEGLLFQEFKRLQARLQAQGFFDPERKRPIPAWPDCIGVVTSPTGAALQDILNTLQRRFPLAEVFLAPTQVQGTEAPPGIVAALEALNSTGRPDVILLARGGGSLEDLWAFNDERVIEAVAASQIPVIAGVGHETDFTLADLAADLRAPTPTAAAELATPNKEDLLILLAETRFRADRSMDARLNALALDLDTQQRRLRRSSPQAQIRIDRQRLDEVRYRAALSLGHRLQVLSAQLQGGTRRLEALNPSAILERGFAVVSKKDGSLVRKVDQVSTGEDLNVQVSDGSFDVEVS